MKKAILFALVIASISLPSCHKSSNSPAPTVTLYDSLGGATLVADPDSAGVMIQQGRLAIRSVVDSAIFVIAADDSINPYFMTLLAEVTASNFSGYYALSEHLTDFFCVATGATSFTYTGLSMANAHNPATNPRISAQVTPGAFQEFVVDVVAGAEQNNVPSYLITSLGRVINSQMSIVVQRQ